MKRKYLSSVKWKKLFFFLLSLVFTAVVSGQKAYRDPVAVNKTIGQMMQNSGGMLKVRTLATSPGGTEVLLMEISNSKTSVNPAILVTGNMTGTTPVSTEAALSLAERILKDPRLCENLTWFIIPMGNPDAFQRYFSKPLYMDPGNSTPFNDDTDDQTDEDGYNDLDGNGVITQMRVKAPDGIWIPLSSDPRLMRRADPLKGEKGIYKLYSEGIDDDGDGRYNEDAPGGTNVDINFPHLFKFSGRRSGLYPGSTPEAYSIMKFAFEHPELAMVMAFGSTNFLLVPPQGGRKGSADFNKITIPEDMGKALGIDVSRTYTMAEIIEMVQPMVPAGMEVDENMVASFLGLGAIVNPLEDDLAFYNKIAEEYKEYLKNKGVKSDRFDPAPAEDGSFELWAYYHLGLPIFSMDFWALPKVKEESSADKLTIEALEKMSSDDFVALSEDKISAFLKERGAPPQYNAKMIVGMVKGGQLTPEKIAGMMKQMPAPAKDDQKGDPKEAAQLAFSDKYLEGRGFIPWKIFKHPSLGEVEIGGFVPFTDNTPPIAMVDSLLDLHLPWVFELVKKLPKLKISETKLTDKGNGIYQVEAWVTNEGFLPFPTAMGKKDNVPAPAILTVEGSNLEFLSGKKRTPVPEVAGEKSVKYTWLIKIAKKGNLTIRLDSKQAGSDLKNLNIEG